MCVTVAHRALLHKVDDFPLHVGPVECITGLSVASLFPNMVGVNSYKHSFLYITPSSMLIPPPPPQIVVESVQGIGW